MRQEGFYRNAAKAAWVAPLVAVAVNYCNRADPAIAQEPRVQMLGGLICFGLVLSGLISGMVALRGTATYRRASILVPAIIGVSFNGLVILSLLAVMHLAGKVSTASAAAVQRQQQVAFAEGMEEGRRSVTEYGGWVGRLATPSAMVGVGSLR